LPQWQTRLGAGSLGQKRLKTPANRVVFYSVVICVAPGVFFVPNLDSVPFISLVMFSRCRQINRTHITNTAGKYAVKPNKYAV
jgi:hypothetical protein